MLYPADDKKNRLRYFGQMRNGIPNDYGTMTWKDGQVYKGIKMKSITIIITFYKYDFNCYGFVSTVFVLDIFLSKIIQFKTVKFERFNLY
jgi:hypothetical protein